MSSTADEPDGVVYVRNAPNGQKAMTMGIVAICLAWLPIVNLVLGMLAFIYGLDGLKSEDHDVRSKSLTGMILGAIAALWWLALFIVAAIASVFTG